MFKNLFKKQPSLTPEEYKYIQMIALRAKWYWEENAMEYTQEQAAADLTIVHTTFPMKLEELLESSDADFHFDIFLIQQAAQRRFETGKVQFSNAIPKYTADENLKREAERKGITIGSTSPTISRNLSKKEPEPKLDCLTSEEYKYIEMIALRAKWATEKDVVPYTQEQAARDIAIVHCNGNPLRLKEMYEASDAVFNGDIAAIKLGLNRETGRLNPNMKRPTFTDYKRMVEEAEKK